MSRRTEQVADLVQTVLADLIARRLKDPALEGALISITRVDVAPDFSNARVFVSVLAGDEFQGDPVKVLQHAEPFLHREMARQLHMRKVPRLKFIADHSIAEAVEITSLLREVRRAEEARAAPEAGMDTPLDEPLDEPLDDGRDEDRDGA